jgi:hypothetical protein
MMRRKGYGDLTPEQEATLLKLGVISNPLTAMERLHQLKLWILDHAIGVTAWSAFLLTTFILKFFGTSHDTDFGMLYQRSGLLGSWTFLFPFYLYWHFKGRDVEDGMSFGIAGYTIWVVPLVFIDQDWWVQFIIWGIHYSAALRIAKSIRLEAEQL